MIKMKTILKTTLVLAIVITATQLQAQKNNETNSITYQCSFDCPSCEAKVMKNIPYEKGVKKVEVDYDKKLVTVEYKSTKNSDEGIKQALEELGYEVKIPDLTYTFGVKGNCGMCKEKIEKAALSVNGVSFAQWDAKTLSIKVAFDNSLTNLDAIHTAIATVGYDTDKIKSDDETYNNLHHCCKYER